MKQNKPLVISRYVLLIGFSVAAIFPFYWMITTAFGKQMWITDPQLFPIPPNLGAMRDVLLEHPFIRWTANTVIIATAGTLGNLFFCCLAAFAFSCLLFKGRDLIFYILLLTMMLPGFLMSIPRFFVINSFGWVNTYWGMFVPSWFHMISVFFLRQYFIMLPQDILEAARVDGANLWQILWKIVLPVSKPVILALFVITFLRLWNWFLWPVIIARSIEMQTLPVGMSEFYNLYASTYNKIMAGSIVSLIPIFVIFILFQKYIEKGIRMGGMV